jgi:hypothetical protein
VAESLAQHHRVGATPLAITDNMNFGNPQKPEIMGQFAGAIDGHGGSLHVRSTSPSSPATSRSTTRPTARAILPTPTIGGVGVIDDLDHMATVAFKQAGDTRAGADRRDKGWLGQSIYLRELQGREEGAPPPVDLAAERRQRRFRARAQIVGRRVVKPATTSPMAACWWRWPRCQGRYLIATDDGPSLVEAARKAGVPAVLLGYSGGPDVTVDGLLTLPLQELRDAHENWLPGYMNSAA